MDTSLSPPASSAKAEISVGDEFLASCAINLTDHTSLKGNETEADIRILCDDAFVLDSPSSLHCAAVCVYPRHVALARRHLDHLEADMKEMVQDNASSTIKKRKLDNGGHTAYAERSPVKVATVVNFPLGTEDREDVIQVASEAVGNGADEIDLVINYSLFTRAEQMRQATQRGGEERDEAADEEIKKASEKAMISACLSTADLVSGVRRAISKSCGVVPGHGNDSNRSEKKLKVILETGELKESSLIRLAAFSALFGGCDFLKTSTGKVPVNATRESVEQLLHVIIRWVNTGMQNNQRKDTVEHVLKNKNDAAGDSERYLNTGFDEEKILTLLMEHSLKADHIHNRNVGLKVAGGVKTLQDCGDYLLMVKNIMGQSFLSARHLRFGASSLLPVLRSYIPCSKASISAKSQSNQEHHKNKTKASDSTNGTAAVSASSQSAPALEFDTDSY